MTTANKNRQSTVTVIALALLAAVAATAAERKAYNASVSSLAYAADRAGVTVTADDIKGLSPEAIAAKAKDLNAQAASASVAKNVAAMKATAKPKAVKPAEAAA